MKCKASLWTILRSVVLRSKLLMLGLLLAVAGSILFALLPALVLENIVNTLTFGGSFPSGWPCCTLGRRPPPAV